MYLIYLNKIFIKLILGECFDVQLKMDQNKLQAMQRSQENNHFSIRS